MRKLTTHLSSWEEPHGVTAGTPYPWNSHIIHLPEAGVLALVDPLPMPEEVADAVERLGPPTHILITCNYHEREADLFRSRWGCATLMHELQAGEAECHVDRTMASGETLWDAVER